jgi:hypothetical protein
MHGINFSVKLYTGTVYRCHLLPKLVTTTIKSERQRTIYRNNWPPRERNIPLYLKTLSRTLLDQQSKLTEPSDKTACNKAGVCTRRLQLQTYKSAVPNLMPRPKSGSRGSDVALREGFMENSIITKKNQNLYLNSNRMIEKM